MQRAPGWAKHGGSGVAVVLALLLSACGGSGGSGSGDSSSGHIITESTCSPASLPGGPYCLTYVGSAYDVHVGQKFEIAVVSADGKNTVLASQTVPRLQGPAFSIAFPQIMQPGVPYYMDYYADYNHNGVCDAPPTDHVWRSHSVQDFYHGTVISLTATDADVVLDTPHDDPWVNDPGPMNTCTQLH